MLAPIVMLLFMPQAATPLYISMGQGLRTRSVECVVTAEKVSKCKIVPGHSLDDVVQDWFDLVLGNVKPGDDDE